MADWTELNDNLLVEIVRRIKLYENFVCFGGVCRSWRTAAVKENFSYASSQIPWLLLPRKTSDNDNCNYNLRSFLSVSTGKTREVFLPEANGKRYISSKGWLLTIAQNLSMSLLHPFSCIQFKLPSMKTFKDIDDLNTPNNVVAFISKCALSANPSYTSNYILMVIHGDLRKLAYYKPVYKVWTTIEEWEGAYTNICYYRGQFYVVNCLGSIMVCDLESGDRARAKVVARLPSELTEKTSCARFYFVESGGLLLVVARFIKANPGKSRNKKTYQTDRFHVFQVELETNVWTEVKDLDNRALFLGFNSSFSLEASESFGSTPNTIYFTDDSFDYYWFPNNRKGGGKDMGIYSIQNGNIYLQLWGNFCNRINPPTWV